MGYRRVLGVSAGAVVLSLGLTASAEPLADHAAASALSDAAAAHLAAGEIEAACQKHDAAVRLEATAERLMAVGECHERAGRTASAWAAYGRATLLARDPTERARAEGEAQRLEPGLSRMSVVVPEGADVMGLEILRDGVRVDRALYGVSIAVDPGTHVIIARSPGRVPWSTRVGIPASPGTVSVTVPLLTWAHSPSVALPDEPSPRRSYATEGEVEDRGATQRTVGWVLGGVGVGSFIAGGVLVAMAAGKQDDLERACDDAMRCDARHRETLHSMRALNAGASALFVTGGLALGTGIVVYLAAPKPQRRWVSVAPVVAPGLAGAALGGRF